MYYGVLDLAAQNVGTNQGRVPENVYSYLEEFFALHNERLFTLLGERFPW